MLERRTDLRIDGRQQFRIVEAVLRLSLELRFGDEHAQHRDEPFANVFRRQRHALWRQVVRLDEVADRLAEPGAEAVLVRAARPGRDPVDVAAHVLVGRLRPLEREIEPQAALVAVLEQRERRVVHRRRGSLAQDRLQIIGKPLGVLEDVLLVLRLVFENDLHAFVQVARHLEPLLDDIGVELDFGKIVVSGRKNTVVPLPRAGPFFFSAPTGCPCLNRSSHSAPSRRIVATSSFDSALTTLAPTPWSPPAVL